jgi:hypothetical protein
MEYKLYQMTKEERLEIINALNRKPILGANGQPVLGPDYFMAKEWERLGKKYGFDHRSARPVPGKDDTFFAAVPVAQPIGMEDPLNK